MSIVAFQHYNELAEKNCRICRMTLRSHHCIQYDYCLANKFLRLYIWKCSKGLTGPDIECIQIFKYNRCNGIQISKMFDKSKCTKCSTGPDIKYTKYS